MYTKKPLKKLDYKLFQRFLLVELEGFEPSSKQAAKLLSTCVAIG